MLCCCLFFRVDNVLDYVVLTSTIIQLSWLLQYTMPTSLDVADDVLKWICVLLTTPITLQIGCTKSGSVLHILLYPPSSLQGYSNIPGVLISIRSNFPQSVTHPIPNPPTPFHVRYPKWVISILHMVPYEKKTLVWKRITDKITYRKAKDVL